jgi:hypothetical protein
MQSEKDVMLFNQISYVVPGKRSALSGEDTWNPRVLGESSVFSATLKHETHLVRVVLEYQALFRSTLERYKENTYPNGDL